VVSALSDAEDVADLVATFHFKRVIVTNLDRTRRLGALLAAITSGAQLAHISTGPHADDALETLEPGALASLLLDAPAH
jgi:flagellar biosynthesis GTPase FlhF